MERSRPRKQRDQKRIEQRYPEMRFQVYPDGSVWTVMDSYSRDVGTPVHEGHVLKVLSHGKEDQEGTPYRFDPTRLESLEKVATRLRREYEFLHSQYSEQLPDLFVQQGIIVLPWSREEQMSLGETRADGTIQSGEVAMLQERIPEDKQLKVWDFLMDKQQHVRRGDFTAEDAAEIERQLTVFLEITKQLPYTTHPEFPEFDHAIPDIAHSGNLIVDVQAKPPALRLVDTNFVLPVTDDLSRSKNLWKRLCWQMMNIEHEVLGKTDADLKHEKFYTDADAFTPIG